MVLNSFQHPHPRVRWAAINAIGQLSTDLGPVLQTQYNQSVLCCLHWLEPWMTFRILESRLVCILLLWPICRVKI